MVTDEHFLHYIWNYQQFTTSSLQLTDGQQLTVFNKGYPNQDSGPDFEEARIKIGEVEWAGHIEIHINASDWNRHHHQSDRAYDNVILHVVWNADEDIYVQQSPLPTLELKDIIDLNLLSKYHHHISSLLPIICSEHLSLNQSLAYPSMIDRVLVERLERKAGSILACLKDSGSDWEEITYRTLCRNFGFSTNKYAFELLAQKLPFSILKKNLQDPIKTQALLYGQAGFLHASGDDYLRQLRGEYSYLLKKYRLEDPLDLHQWKFGKMRPANFPSVRIAQLAALLHQHPKLFSLLTSIQQPKEIIRLFNYELFPYWTTHYDFGKSSRKSLKGPGKTSLDTILINTVAPLLAAYSKYTGEQVYMDRAILLLEAIKPEKNRIVKAWEKIGKCPTSAFESQAQIQLFNEYCKMKKCLQCTIGVELLNKS